MLYTKLLLYRASLFPAYFLPQSPSTILDNLLLLARLIKEPPRQWIVTGKDNNASKKTCSTQSCYVDERHLSLFLSPSFIFTLTLIQLEL